MARFCANLTMLFNEVDFLSRFKQAKQAGFEGVEYLFPYDFDKNQLAELLQENHLKQVLHNLPAGNWAGGERGIAILPDRITEFQEGVGLAIEYANTLGCTQLNVLAGVAPTNANKDALHKTFIENLKFAATQLKQAGIKCLMEPINYFDIPGFFVNKTQEAVDILNEVGSDNLFIQYDIYHMQRMEGEIVNTIKRNLSKIAHIQLADNPGRNEPGTGEINYPFIFRELDSMGYTGWIGAEYKPKATTEAGLGWFELNK